MEQHIYPRQQQLLFGIPIILGAFLLFQIQPLIIKTLLPQFGGSASTWTVSLLFFQGALLLGYMYAHSAKKFGNREMHFHIFIAVLAFLLTLMLKPWLGTVTQTASPTLALLLTLSTTIGLPYVLLAGTSPLLQRLSITFSPLPYRYYALSNAASLCALVSFPFLEFFLPLQTLWIGWFSLFSVYIAFIVYVHTWIYARRTNEIPIPGTAIKNIRIGKAFQWISLAALGTLLLTSVTTILSEDITATPLIWIIPLALYLLSFIVCFGRAQWHGQRSFALYTILSILIMLTAMHGSLPMLIQQILAFGLVVFCGCMLVHGELVRSKPDTRQLTLFYIYIATGGVVGGGVSSVIAPLILPDYLELHLALVASVLLAGYVLFQTDKKIAVRRLLLRGYFLPYIGIAVLIPLLLINIITRLSGLEYINRNFYGVLKVTQINTDERNAWRVLMHGGTNHGTQYTSPSFRTRPTSYYGPGSGVGRLLQTYVQQPNTRVGIIGLGTGTLAAYGKPGDEYVFYEINPAVLAVAHSKFTYLTDSAAHITTHVGDARLVLEKQLEQKFDALVVDAFSNDAIPIHLLTNEAIHIYLKHLKVHGVLAVHISNRHVDLRPIVSALAEHNSLNLVSIKFDAANNALETSSHWILLSRTKQALDRVSLTNAATTDHIPVGQVWTDQYSSILPLLK